ncbi:hypothetical protein GALMADRAFT_787572 [Galerina marginata CBS 339.88]|uniref:Uncharacterized protein n=1 Tax=Galerina marginata (strain CBS 339.88) TaxID=685588 RepID=A0A067SKP9_GALM3|nr:hypothetical protein GALMADRAFT_787572 [Galerina marginata CBS 339.88]
MRRVLENFEDFCWMDPPFETPKNAAPRARLFISPTPTRRFAGLSRFLFADHFAPRCPLPSLDSILPVSSICFHVDADLHCPVEFASAPPRPPLLRRGPCVPFVLFTFLF